MHPLRVHQEQRLPIYVSGFTILEWWPLDLNSILTSSDLIHDINTSLSHFLSIKIWSMGFRYGLKRSVKQKKSKTKSPSLWKRGNPPLFLVTPLRIWFARDLLEQVQSDKVPIYDDWSDCLIVACVILFLSVSLWMIRKGNPDVPCNANIKKTIALHIHPMWGYYGE